MSIGKRIKTRREALHMTQDELAKKIGYKSRSSINKIELELTDIPQSKINTFADALKTTPTFLLGLENADSDLIKLINHAGWNIEKLANHHIQLTKNQNIIELDQTEINHLTEKMINLLNDQLVSLQKFSISTSFFSLPYYGQIASAGLGEYLFDDLPSTMIDVQDTPKNRQADFAIAVKGDSMWPTYANNDILLIKKQNTLQLGDIGIFIINGEVFVKELGHQCLISHNKTYQPIHFNQEMRIDCIGKVITKLERN